MNTQHGHQHQQLAWSWIKQACLKVWTGGPPVQLSTWTRGSSAWKVKGKLLSRVRLLATPWTAAHQAPLSMGFSRQECWSGVPFWVINPNIQYALQYVLSAFLFFQRVFLNCGFSILFYCQSFHMLDLAYLPVIFIIFFLILFCFCFILLFKH